MKRLFLLLFLSLVLTVTALSAQTNDSAIAGRYADYALQFINAGNWAEAETALERAQDFADESSDLSYMLALVQWHENRPLIKVMEALDRALALNKWRLYNEAQACLLQAQACIRMRDYSGALNIIDGLAYRPASTDADLSLARLQALMGQAPLSGSLSAVFLSACQSALERYPNDSRFLNLIFRFEIKRLNRAARQGSGEEALIDLCLSRYPSFVAADPGLLWQAALFTEDADAAKQLITNYRAAASGSSPGIDPASIAPALERGVMSGAEALSDLFSAATIDWRIVNAIEALLNDDDKKALNEKLSSFSGVIIEDTDQDDWPESWAAYTGGKLMSYQWDLRQDGELDYDIVCKDGLPASGVIKLEAGVDTAMVTWGVYPALLQARMGELICNYRPAEFNYRPLTLGTFFAEAGTAGFIFPRRNGAASALTSLTLKTYAALIERPAHDFPGAVERIETSGGVPFRSNEYLGSQIVAVTDYKGGLPSVQRLDMDLDGRFETIRHYTNGVLVLSESDWSGDGVYETGEEYLEDGRIIRSWDMDGDGVRETIEGNNE